MTSNLLEKLVGKVKILVLGALKISPSNTEIFQNEVFLGMRKIFVENKKKQEKHSPVLKNNSKGNKGLKCESHPRSKDKTNPQRGDHVESVAEQFTSKREIENKLMIIESFLRPTFFLTKWVEKTINSDATRLYRDLVLFYKNIIDYEDYLGFYKRFKAFYQGILQFDKESINHTSWVEAYENFKEFLPFTLKKILFYNIHSASEGKVKALNYIYSLNMMKRGCGALLAEQIIISVTDTLKLLTMDPEPISVRSRYFLKMAASIIFKRRKINLEQDLHPPTKKSTYEYTRCTGGGYQILGNDEYISGDLPRCQNEYHDLLDDHQSTNLARVTLSVEANKIRFLTIQGVKHQCSAIAVQHAMLQDWKDSGYSTMANDFDEKFNRAVNSGLVFKYDYSVDYSAATDGLKPNVTEILINEVCKIYKLDSKDTNIVKEIVSPRDLTLDGMLIVNYNQPDEEYLIEKIKQNFRWQDDQGMTLRQSNGQLMGGPLSFPLLCVANFATFLELEYAASYHRIVFNYFCRTDKKKKKKQPKSSQRVIRDILISIHKDNLETKKDCLLHFLLINGDDAYAPLQSINEVQDHKKISDSYGLKINEKSIICPFKTCRQLNSVVYYGSKRINYLNLSIYCDNNIKNVGSLTSDNFSDLADTFNWNSDIQLGFLNKHMGRIVPDKNLKDMWLSKDLGGLGLKCLCPENVSDQDNWNIRKRYYNLYLTEELTAPLEKIYKNTFISVSKEIEKTIADKAVVIESKLALLEAKIYNQKLDILLRILPIEVVRLVRKFAGAKPNKEHVRVKDLKKEHAILLRSFSRLLDKAQERINNTIVESEFCGAMATKLIAYMIQSKKILNFRLSDLSYDSHTFHFFQERFEPFSSFFGESKISSIIYKMERISELHDLLLNKFYSLWKFTSITACKMLNSSYEDLFSMFFPMHDETVILRNDYPEIHTDLSLFEKESYYLVLDEEWFSKNTF